MKAVSAPPAAARTNINAAMRTINKAYLDEELAHNSLSSSIHLDLSRSIIRQADLNELGTGDVELATDYVKPTADDIKSAIALIKRQKDQDGINIPNPPIYDPVDYSIAYRPGVRLPAPLPMPKIPSTILRTTPSEDSDSDFEIFRWFDMDVAATSSHDSRPSIELSMPDRTPIVVPKIPPILPKRQASSLVGGIWKDTSNQEALIEEFLRLQHGPLSQRQPLQSPVQTMKFSSTHTPDPLHEVFDHKYPGKIRIHHPEISGAVDAEKMSLESFVLPSSGTGEHQFEQHREPYSTDENNQSILENTFLTKSGGFYSPEFAEEFAAFAEAGRSINRKFLELGQEYESSTEAMLSPTHRLSGPVPELHTNDEFERAGQIYVAYVLRKNQRFPNTQVELSTHVESDMNVEPGANDKSIHTYTEEDYQWARSYLSDEVKVWLKTKCNVITKTERSTLNAIGKASGDIAADSSFICNNQGQEHSQKTMEQLPEAAVNKLQDQLEWGSILSLSELDVDWDKIRHLSPQALDGQTSMTPAVSPSSTQLPPPADTSFVTVDGNEVSMIPTGGPNRCIRVLDNALFGSFDDISSKAVEALVSGGLSLAPLATKLSNILLSSKGETTAASEFQAAETDERGSSKDTVISPQKSLQSPTKPAFGLEQSMERGTMQSPTDVASPPQASNTSPRMPDMPSADLATTSRSPQYACIRCNKAYTKGAYLLKHEAKGDCKAKTPKLRGTFSATSTPMQSMEDCASNIDDFPSLKATSNKGLPYCTTCNTEFSSVGRLRRHVSHHCPVLAKTHVPKRQSNQQAPQLPEMPDGNTIDGEQTLAYPARLRLFSKNLASSFSPHAKSLEPFEDLPRKPKLISFLQPGGSSRQVAKSTPNTASGQRAISEKSPSLIFSFTSENLCAIAIEKLEHAIEVGLDPTLQRLRVWPSFGRTSAASKTAFGFKVTSPDDINLVAAIRDLFPDMVTKKQGDQVFYVLKSLHDSDSGSPLVITTTYSKANTVVATNIEQTWEAESRHIDQLKPAFKGEAISGTSNSAPQTIVKPDAVDGSQKPAASKRRRSHVGPSETRPDENAALAGNKRAKRQMTEGGYALA